MDPCTLLSNISIVDNYVVTPIKPYFSRAFNYKNKLQNLKEEVQQLKNKRDTVQSLVADAKKNGRLIHQHVIDWLEQTEHLLAEDGQRLAEDEDRTKEKCFVGLCPNFKTRYQISKKAETEVVALAKLREVASTFNAQDTISYNPPPEASKPMIVRDYDAFESRKALVKDIKEAFAVGGAKIIGVYGLGGVGKTTLVREVARQVKEEKLFDATVMVTVTATPNLEKIQEEIAESLGLKFDVKSENVRASKLRERLKEEKKILVILDDLWKKLDLDAVGIPLPSEHAGCNILMSSRFEKVLSREMGVEMKLQLKVLQNDEARALFEKMAGDKVKQPDFLDVAKQLSERCVGLPVLLVAVARALKDEELHAWKDALKHLARFDNTDDHLNEQIFTALKLTYDYLKGKDSKALFLLCGQLGPFSTPILDLLKYGVGLGLFESYSTLDDVRNRLYKLVDDLKASCLLLEGDHDGQVKMHDVVRHFAIKVAAEKEHAFTTIDDDELKEWPVKGELEQCTAISLPYSRIPEELPAVLECPRLKSFLLASKDPSLSIETDYFKEAKELKVLVMKQMDLSPLPSSLQLVANLQTLCLHNCYLDDITIIGGLRQLEVLSLVGSRVVRLPSEIKNLTGLKLLDLSDCWRLKVIPPNVLSCLTRLEDLYMKNSFENWETEGPKSEGKNANVRELKHLSKLVNLDLHIEGVGALSEDMFFGNLKRFRIFVGYWRDWDNMQEATRSMKLQLNTSGLLGEGFKVLLERTQHLEIKQLEGFKSILYGLGRQGGLTELMHLHVSESTDIEFVVDWSEMGQPTIAFPRLEVLSLESLGNLEKICNGQPLLHGSFSKLRVLKVDKCHKLKHLISSSLVRGLQELEEISALSCNGMEVIIAEERDGGANQDEEINLIRLRKLEIVNLPQFKSFRSKVKVAALPKLDELTLEGLNIESLWQWHGQLPAISFPDQNLTSLEVIGCHHLKHLLCPSMARSLKQLKNLKVENCRLMEAIIFTEESYEGEEGDRIFEMRFIELESLRLKRLPTLKRFCTASFVEFPHLESLTMQDCNELQTFISNRTDSEAHEGMESKGNLHVNSVQPLFDEKVAFLVLEEIRISDMGNLQRLWNDRFAAGSFCTLKSLRISECNELVKIFTSSAIGKFRRLERLSIERCSSLEVIFDLQELNVIKEAHDQLDSPMEIELDDLPELRHIWSTMACQHTITFRNVHSMKVVRCPLLQNVFPSSIARDLPQLEQLRIYSCDVMEEVVGMLGETSSDVAPAGVVFSFPKLTLLSIMGSGNLRSFYPGVHTLDCPKLKTLQLERCERANLFTAATQSRRIVDQKIQQPLFLVEQVMPPVEELLLDCRNTTAARLLWQFQFPADQYLPQLKILTLRYIKDEELNVLPLGFLGRLPNLETLEVYKAALEALFSYRLVDAEKHPVALKRLSYLRIHTVDNLRHLWENDHPLDRVAPNLETLKVWSCGSLINLGPSSATFHTLTTFFVHGCDGLLNLVTTSTVKSLERLVKLTVKSCKMITEIIGAEQHGEETKYDEIHFSKLESLELIDLHNLKSFCSETCNFHFPRLKRVTVEGCPSMSIFCLGVLSTPKLRRVRVDKDDEYKVRWEDDLNSTIKRMHEEMAAVTLSELPGSSCGQPTSDFEAAREEKKDLSTAEDPMASKHLPLEVESTTKFVTEGQDVKSASKGSEITQLASAHQDSDVTSERKGYHGLVPDGSVVESHRVPVVEKSESTTHVESVVPSKLDVKGQPEDTLKQQTLEAQKTTAISVPREAESDHVPLVRKRKASTRAESSVHSQQEKEFQERQDSFVIEVTDVFPLSSPSDAVAEEAFQPSSSSGAGLPPNFPTTEETPSRSSIYSASTKLLEEISSITDAGEPSLDIEISGPTLTSTSEYLHNQRKALRDYFNMPLEDIHKANAFDDIERISSAIIRESSSLDEKKILEDLLSRLAEFREKIPKAMLMKDTAEAYRSSQPRKSTDLQENLALSKDQLGMLASKMSEVLEEKAELVTEIQRLIGRKEALLDLENSIASEMQNTYKSASRNVADWRNFKEESKHVEDNWYKGEETLIQANASWTLFKRRLALGL